MFVHESEVLGQANFLLFLRMIRGKLGARGRGVIKVINIQIEETCVEHHWSKDAILVFDVGGSVRVQHIHLYK